MATLIQLIITGTLFSLLIWMLWKYQNAFAFLFSNLCKGAFIKGFHSMLGGLFEIL
jgi:hypothetical protein